MKNDFNRKWNFLFATKRQNTEDGKVTLTIAEQKELLHDAEKAIAQIVTKIWLN